MVESVLVAGIALYFLIRIWLFVRYKSSWSAKKISKGNFTFWGVDLAIFLVVVFQLTFPHFAKMSAGFLSEAIRIFGVSLFIIGVFLSNWGRFALGKNWRPALIGTEVDNQQKLVTGGPFSFIRHPIYSGMILLGFGFEISLLSWFFLAIVPAVFLLYRQAKSEERALEARFPQYRQYKKSTGMFLPKIF